MIQSSSMIKINRSAFTPICVKFTIQWIRFFQGVFFVFQNKYKINLIIKIIIKLDNKINCFGIENVIIKLKLIINESFESILKIFLNVLQR